MKQFYIFSLGVIGFLLMPFFSDAKDLRVTTIVRDPFVRIDDDGQFTGFSVELWDAIAKDLGWTYTFEPVDTFVDLLRAPRNATSDLAIANISITSDRVEVMDFSAPIFNSGLQIMIGQHSAVEKFVIAVFDRKSFIVLAEIFVVFIFIAHILWFVEKKKKDTKGYACGIASTAWGMCTVGSFGKKLPCTIWGRIIFLVWMSVGTIAFLFYTAQLVSTMTMQQISISIDSYNDLHNKKVGTTKGSTAEGFLRKHGIEMLTYESIDRLFEDVAVGKIDAAVHDAPLVRYFVSHKGNGRVTFVKGVFNEDTYGIAMPKGSMLRDEIDLALLRLRENGTYQGIYDTWFDVQ